MSYRIALNFEDGVTRVIDCHEGEKVLDAAYRNKVNLPMDCSDGVCGTCKCQCEQGIYDLGSDYIEDALNAEEVAQGQVLTCQMTVSSDCIIAVPVPASVCKVRPAEHGATIRSVERISGATIVLTLSLDQPEALDFLPGQYVNLGVPDTRETRAYSFCSPPGVPEVSFLIRNIPGGLMSSWLTERALPGARMRFTGPNGSFFLRAVERPIVMLAGGTGLAPILSMLDVLAERGCDHPVHMIYGVNHDSDLAELDRIKRAAAHLPGFTWDCCVADQNSSWPRKGYVTHHLTDVHLNGGDCDVYLCGPPPMVEAVRTFLKDKGVQPTHFYYEKFAPSEQVLA